MRRCVGCGTSMEKDMLVRIVRGLDGEIHVDFSGKANGRGAYICKNSECLDRAFKRRGFEKSFKEAISAETIENLKKELEWHG